MKNKTITFGLIALLVIAITLLMTQSSSGTTVLAAESFLSTYKSTPSAVLLDVRTKDEFDSGHIDGARNIDFQSPSFVQELATLDTTKPYFVYCRSGNRSGQATALMQKNGFATITELQGGLSAGKSLTLVKGASLSTEDYVVDASDMVKAEALLSGIKVSPSNSLSAKEISGLIQMREEEKLARDVYTTLGQKWGMRVFTNIASSEQTHTDAVKVLLDRYGIADPVKDTTVGVFTSPTMQNLYTTLVAEGMKSQKDALTVGATIEDLDINDLDVLMKETTKQDILVTYSNLQKGSRNHLRAFVKNLGGSYTPKYITKEAYTSIIAGAQERGRQ